MRTHYQLLTCGSLLTLCAEDDKSGQPLANALHYALRSGQRSVWVDCRHVLSLSSDALLLLRQSAAKLWQYGGHLVLCRLPAATRASLAGSKAQPLAADLLDAELYGLDCPPAE